jgi:phosphohistidine phosphatase SixA
MRTLTSAGEVRSSLWPDVIDTSRLTHVAASHKVRTQQTVAAVALAAGLPLDIVPNIADCEPGSEGSENALQPHIDYIRALPDNSVALIAGHSTTTYQIMEAFGIDTSDPVRFPRLPNGRIEGFGNLWELTITPNGNVSITKHQRYPLVLKKDSVDPLR